ncbi:metal ABC transporter ATP-binding protein [Peribacillus psychrosaccharolyticus]|uniref:Metal ABC transporter ATP-binding protein n=1 Tax=Peribacillus psychrosaccharolyticus TaxID=1407 RepID=A0A974S0B7_PERPY|nr:metal ABC transporter ATP-binding protein [Peribacillus psychrosaccharolyticus]MEC2056359.1 metal ABC transporter ATP-binding protein [Peribacillus psychrosaccharolyticus]MED3743761.1 metal ABC transporter ATP-binding protein [Peribacillus psychrosaccharolyticus]QQT00477.1 metal ABC transporter ATP-binding protein [Peribacillus psychrosaccharolyticus]
MEDMYALNIQDLSVSYHGKPALRTINIAVLPGSLVGIIGPNGAGKSTFIKALLDLIPKDNGSVRIFGKTFSEQRQLVAYVPQRNNIDWDFPINVLETVLLGTYPSLGIFKRPKQADKARALACLKKVGMEDYHDRQIGELSGGQQQRVFLARALVQEPEILLLDEPFVGIDILSEENMMNILRDLKSAGKTILVVHHDLSKVDTYFEQLLVLNKKQIGYGDVKEVVRNGVINQAYLGQLSIFEKAEVM